MAATENCELFSRCNISEDVLRRIKRTPHKTPTGSNSTLTERTSNSQLNSKSSAKQSIDTTGSRSQRGNNSISNNKKAFNQRFPAAENLVSRSNQSIHNSKNNKVTLERLLLSVPLDNDVANFSENEAAVSSRGLPLYSENDESSFCLPSSGYKSDSENRGRSKYRIRTCNSANPSPNHSPERTTNKSNLRRTQSHTLLSNSDRVHQIREQLKDRQRKDSLEASRNKSISPTQEKLKGINRSRTERQSGTRQKTDLKSRSVDAIQTTERNDVKNNNFKNTPVNNSNNNINAKTNSVLRSRSFNSIDSTGSARNRYLLQRAALKSTAENSNTHSVHNKSSLKPSGASAFEQVRQQFGTDKWRKPSNLNSSADPLRSNSFSTLQDAFESRRAFQKNNDKQKSSVSIYSTNKNNSSLQYLDTQQHQSKKSFSDVESVDIISQRRERRRLKRESYSQRRTTNSDRSDSETETEDQFASRLSFDRSQRRTNPRRSRQRHYSDSNDENNNETASDKTLDSGVFELAVSSFSENISQLAKRYNSNEFFNAELADCLSPKSGYSSASESLAESLAESTTTFCDSGDEAIGDMDRKKRASRFKFKQTDKSANVKTAVLNSTRAKNLNGTSMMASSTTTMTSSSSSTTSSLPQKQNITSNNVKKDATLTHNTLKQKHHQQQQQRGGGEQSTTTPVVNGKDRKTRHTKSSSSSSSPSCETITNKTLSQPVLNAVQTNTPQSKTSKSASKEISTATNSSNLSEDITHVNNPETKKDKQSILSSEKTQSSSEISSTKDKKQQQHQQLRDDTPTQRVVVSDNKNTTKSIKKLDDNSNHNKTSSKENNHSPSSTSLSKRKSLKQSSSAPLSTSLSPQASLSSKEKVSDGGGTTTTTKNNHSRAKKSTETTLVEKSSGQNETHATPSTDLLKVTDVSATTPKKDRHHNCCSPVDHSLDNTRKSNHSPTPTKAKRRVSHHNCVSSDSDASRSNTPTKTRRVSHHGCFSPLEKSSDSDNSRSSTPTKHRRTSHHSCFKPVSDRSSDSSDNSRSNTPTRQNINDNSPTTSSSRAQQNERKSSHHNCVSSSNQQQKAAISPRQQQSNQQQREQLSKDSTQQKKLNNPTIEINEPDQDMSNTTKNSRKVAIVGAAQRRDEIKPKLARTCVSPTLNKNIELEINTNTKQLKSIDERSIYVDNKHLNVDYTDGAEQQLLVKSNLQATDNTVCNNNITINDNNKSVNSDEESQHDGRTAQEKDSKHNTQQQQTTTHDHCNIDKSQQANMETIDTSQQSKQHPLKTFKIDHRRSSIQEQNDKHKLQKQGEAIEIVLNIDKSKKNTSPPTTTATPGKVSGKAKVPLPVTSPKPTSGLRNKNNEKGVQCLLLTGESKQKESVQLIDVTDTAKQILYDNNETLDALGGDILQNIQFTYPKYLVSPEQYTELKQKLESQGEGECYDDDELEESSSESEDDEGRDETDSAAVTVTTNNTNNSKNKNEKRFKKERAKSKKLEMENTRLQQLLYEVEKARAGTMKALLHVNTMLNKVQVDNTNLESDLVVCGQDRKNLEENLQQYAVKELENIDKIGGGGSKKGQSLSIVVDQWKKEKKELLSELNKFKGKSEEGEKQSTRLQIQYKKVKEQLEHSNNAFTMTLRNNLEATKRMEAELKHSLDEKQELYKKLNEGNKYKREIESLKNEMAEMNASNEELQDENDNLGQKVKYLEKQKKQLQQEEEELHEQVEHSQEIIEKLTEVEDDLKDQLDAEIKDKEYLQECLDETGNILYQLRHNEQRLLHDKDTLIVDLEAEVEEKQTLQTTLDCTLDEQKEIVGRLQDMTHIHTTVKESLQQANKKEKNYQEQIEALTKTNHILHYTLEKEKEERMDLQEMHDIIESGHKKFKNETLARVKDMEVTIDQLNFENHHLTTTKNELEKKCEKLQVTLEDEEEKSETLSQKLSRVEQLKESIETELESLQNSSEQIEKSKGDLQKACHELDVDLKISKQQIAKLSSQLEEKAASLEKNDKHLHETKLKLEEYRNDYDDLQSKNRERMKRLRELESDNEGLTEQKDRYLNRLNYYENETKDLRKKVNEQTEEIGTLRIESQRLARERDTHKRNCEMSVHDFEVHKTKCTETLKRLKDEIIELSNKIVEKDRLAMKQKEHFQDQIENTQNDLQMLRSVMDSNIRSDIKKARRINEANDSGSEKLDLGVLRNSHDKFRDEFQSHVDKLENMLKDSHETSDTVTVVQSPMSKIKLEELKQLRNEMFEMHSELTTIRTKFANISADITALKLGTPSRYSKEKSDEKLKLLEDELLRLNELITRIECRHQAVMSRNAILLQRTLNEDDVTAKDLVKKFQVISLEGENNQLKTLIGILKKKYDFDESELADELKKVRQGVNGVDSSTPMLNGNDNNNNDEQYPSDENGDTPKSLPTRVGSRLDRSLLHRSMSARRSQRNYSFMNEMVNTPDSTMTTTPSRTSYTNQGSSGISSHSSDDDDYKPTQRLKRNNTLPPRNRRPRQ